MKTDLYTKTVLTVIAVVLSINLLSDFDIMPKAYANDSTQSVVDVRIREIDPIILGTLPVEFRGTMPVNIKRIIGSNLYGSYLKWNSKAPLLHHMLLELKHQSTLFLPCKLPNKLHLVLLMMYANAQY